MSGDIGSGENPAPKMQPRLEGLADLLGIGIGELDSANYPASVQLPAEIHQPAQEALQQTLGDGRERQLSYNHEDGSWAVGVETGPKTDILNARGGYIRTRGLLKSIYHSSFKRPLVALHTHPRISDAVVTQLMDQHADRRDWGVQETEDWYRHYRTVTDIQTAFPSPDDVRTAHARFPKELVQMLYTPFSSFMMVRNNLSGRRQGENTGERYLATRQGIGQYRDTIARVLAGYSVAEERTKLLKSLSAALGGEYSLFHSFETPTDPEPPILEKYSSK